MGYEVTFYFHDRLADGKYNLDVQNERTRKVGNLDEHVTTEKLAAIIVKEYARSDILVKDVKIHEYVKKEVSFRETKGGGVVIAGRKYNLGLREVLELTENDDENQTRTPCCQTQAPVATPNIVQVAPSPPPVSTPSDVVAISSGKAKDAPLLIERKAEVFDPPPELARDAQKFRVTIGNKYQILDEKRTVVTSEGRSTPSTVYKIKNDVGSETFVPSMYFRPDQPGLVVTESYIDSQGVMRDRVTMDRSSMGTRASSDAPKLLYSDSPAAVAPPVACNFNPEELMQKMDSMVQQRRKIV